MKVDFKTVPGYIKSFPKDIQEILNRLRSIVQKIAPEAEESISYGMPAYKLNKKPLVYFAAFKNHIGFYATPSGHSEFEEELTKYKQGKGSVQFPFDDVPYKLIEKIVRFRVGQNEAKTKEKA